MADQSSVGSASIRDTETERERVLRVLFFIPTLGGGGTERVLITLLRRFDRRSVKPFLALMRAEGPHIGDVPDDTPVEILHSRTLWTVVPGLTRLLRRFSPEVFVAMTGGASIPAVIAQVIAGSDARLVLSERNVLVGSDHSAKCSLILAPIGTADSVSRSLRASVSRC